MNPETKDENSQKNDGRRFARIMQKRASRLKMLTELEREKRKGETIKAAWKEDRRRQQEDTEQQTKGKSLLNRIFNGDPHPGNILVLDDDRLGLIDYGQVKRLSSTSQLKLARLVCLVADSNSTDLDVAQVALTTSDTIKIGTAGGACAGGDAANIVAGGNGAAVASSGGLRTQFQITAAHSNALICLSLISINRKLYNMFICLSN